MLNSVDINAQFNLLWEKNIEELKSCAKLWQHKVTKAEILSISNSDENKVFGVTLKTPPKDSTGVAHILEHSVLCGSDKYPSKEPFVELLKGSLQTFLNAFTYPDKTCYPVASCNLQDFYNLIDVYLDAVFFPKLSRETFEQEGWHIEAEDKATPLIYKGVVYNEMKGVYSSPDSILVESSQQTVFANNTYGLDSGGNPEEILSLDYKQFIDFHKNYYHPSNSRFFFWGDDLENKRLEIVAEVIKDFSYLQVDSKVSLQEAFAAPRIVNILYAASEDDIDACMLTVNWLLPESSDVFANFALQMLDHILLGLPGSVLRKVLIESGLGEDIVGVGLEAELCQMYYSVGLRGVKERDLVKVETLIMDTLNSLLKEGIEAEAIEAAINSVEFSLRENNTGSYPVGLAIMVRSLTTWLYGVDPLALIAFEQPLETLKSRIKAGEKVFEQLIQTYFFNNSHRVTVNLLPDLSLAEKRQKEEENKLAVIKQNLNSFELEQLVAESQKLKELQQQPDSTEALAAIPCLKLDDMPRDNKKIPCEISSLQGHTVLFHDLPTAGIVYLDLAFSFDSLAEELLPFLPLFGRCLTEMGTLKHDYVQLGVQIAAKSGGIDAGPAFFTGLEDRKNLKPNEFSDPYEKHIIKGKLMLSAKFTFEKTLSCLDILQEILLDLSLENKERFRQMLFEEKARLEQQLIPAGHSLVATRLAANQSLAGYLSEISGGISYLDMLRTLTDNFDELWTDILQHLKNIRHCVINRSGLILNISSEEKFKASLLADAEKLLKILPSAVDIYSASLVCSLKQLPFKEALIVPAQVNYVGKGADIYKLGYKYHGSMQVIVKHLRTGWLWEKVRVLGGAYGAFCLFDRLTGTFNQVSYRDPNVANTIKAFDDTAAYLNKLSLSKAELEQSIIGAIGELDKHLLPEAKGMASFSRYVCNDKEEFRAKMRQEILETSIKDFNNFAEIMAEVTKQGNVCLLGGSLAETYAAANDFSVRKA